MAEQSNIERISNFSFPSNHLLTIQLVRDISAAGSIKPEHFFFVTLAPGGSSQENASGRTYDFNNSVTLKYAVQEISGLAFALKQYAMGNGKHINYTKFTKSQAGQKVVSLDTTSKTQQTKNGEIIIAQVLFKVTSNSNTQSIAMTLDQAYSLSEVCDLMFKKGADLEFNRQINTVSYNKDNNRPNNGNNRSFNQNSNNNEAAPFDSDDNGSFLNQNAGGGFGGFGGGNPFN